MTIRRDKRGAGIEPDVWIADYQRILRESGIDKSMLNYKGLIAT